MPIPALLRTIPLRAAVLLVLAAEPATAGWLSGGNRLDAGLSGPLLTDIGPDGSGGTYVAWLEPTVLGPELRLQRLQSDGVPATDWPAGGRRVAAFQSTSGAGPVRLTANPGAGVYLAWIDTRNGSPDVYAACLDASGNPAPGWPLDGLPVCTAPGDQVELAMIPDLAGNAYIAWTDLRDGTADIYVIRIGPSGFLPGWFAGGTRVTPGPGEHRRATLASDVANGVVLGWMRIEQESDLFAVHFRGDGLRDPAWSENGEPVCVAPGFQDAPRALALASGVTVFVWVDERNGMETNLYAAGLSSGGSLAAGWAVDGTPLCTVLGDQLEPAVAPDGAGGAFVAWTDDRPIPIPVPLPGRVDPGTHEAPRTQTMPSGAWPGGNIFATRVTSTGAIASGWQSQGVPVCLALGNQSAPRMAPDPSGGVYLAWRDGRSGVNGLWGTRLDAAGRHDCWLDDGTPLTDPDAPVEDAQLAHDGSGGAVAVWRDTRSSATHIYAQRLDPFGVAAAEALPGPAFATPSQVQLRWAVTACRPRWSLQRLVGEGWVLLAHLLADDSGRIVHTDRMVEPGTRVGYRLFPTGEDPAAAAEVFVDIPNAPRFAVTRVHPNPASGQVVVVAMNVDTREALSLELLDIAGRRVLDQRLPAFGPGAHEIGLLLPAGLEAGVYRLRLLLGTRSATTTLVLVR